MKRSAVISVEALQTIVRDVHALCVFDSFVFTKLVQKPKEKMPYPIAVRVLSESYVDSCTF